MTIKILSIRFQAANGANTSRHADIIISDGVTHYTLGVGDLPLVGDLQPILDARESELWGVAVAKDDQRTTRQVRRLVYNSRSAGGWDRDEFQEAWFEERAGDSTKANALHARRAAIRAEWPL
jgi:hypothetical protein